MQQTSITRLGLWHGASLGLALATGLWLPEVIRLWGVPLRYFYPTLAIGTLVLVLIAGMAGVLSARLPHAGLSFVLWLVAALVLSGVVGGLLFEGQSLAAKLQDLRFWDQIIYPSSSASRLRGGLAGFFIVLVLAVYGLLQESRLEGLRAERDRRFWLTGRGWFLLLVGLLPLFGIGLIANEIILRPVYTAPWVVDQAIRVVRTTEGDLFDLSQVDGVNYNALRGERERLGGVYSLQLGQVESGPVSTIYVVVEFESGVWLLCRLMGESLSHCADPSAPYFVGFPTLLQTGELSSDCPACRFRVTAEQQAWLAERSIRFVTTPQVSKKGQLGDVVLMEAHTPEGTGSVVCFFKGIGPIALESCQDG